MTSWIKTQSKLNYYVHLLSSYLICFVQIYSEVVADKFICKSCFTLHLKRLICNLGAIFLPRGWLAGWHQFYLKRREWFRIFIQNKQYILLSSLEEEENTVSRIALFWLKLKNGNSKDSIEWRFSKSVEINHYLQGGEKESPGRF